MKSIKAIVKSKFFATTMSCLILFATTYQTHATTLDIFENKNLTGEQMFREIFFFQGGKMLNKIPKSFQREVTLANNLSNTEKLKRDQIIENIVGLIKANSPSYFNNLKKAIQSKNPYKVKDIMNTGSELIVNSLGIQSDFKELQKQLGDRKIDLSDRNQIEQLKKELSSKANASSKQELVGEDACIAVAVVGVLAIAVVGVAVVVSVIVEVINIANDQIQRQGSSNLKMDEYTNHIILNYS